MRVLCLTRHSHPNTVIQPCNFKEATPYLTWVTAVLTQVRRKICHIRLQVWRESVCLPVEACETGVSGADVLEG